MRDGDEPMSEDSNIKLLEKLHVLVSPTLNFNGNKGLRDAVSFDGTEEQIVNINEKYDMRQMEKWQVNSINETITRHKIKNDRKTHIAFQSAGIGHCAAKR